MLALVVDDSRTVRMVLRGILERHGFTVAEAGHGLEALARLKEIARPDVVFIDWNMPEMDGLQLVEALRAGDATNGLCLVMVTTVNDYEQVKQALAAGADEYIMKPFTQEMIEEKLALLGIGTPAQ